MRTGATDCGQVGMISPQKHAPQRARAAGLVGGGEGSVVEARAAAEWSGGALDGAHDSGREPRAAAAGAAALIPTRNRIARKG